MRRTASTRSMSCGGISEPCLVLVQSTFITRTQGTQYIHHIKREEYMSLLSDCDYVSRPIWEEKTFGTL